MDVSEGLKGPMRIRFLPSGKVANVSSGATVYDAANIAGVHLESLCGGKGICGKCRVIVRNGIAPPTSAEERLLTRSEIERGVRLACQAIILRDTEVMVPESSRISGVSILEGGVERKVGIAPLVKKCVLQVRPATLERPIPDLENVLEVWHCREAQDLQINLRTLQDLPRQLRRNDGVITLTTANSRLLDIESGDTTESLYGIAFDIGTTTVVGNLVDLNSGEQLAVASMLNPQTRYGDDVVSRIEFILADSKGLNTLRGEIVNALNTLIMETCRQAGIDQQQIYEVTIVGNTTMHHLFLGIDASGLTRAPYVPVTVRPLELRAADVGLAIHPEGLVCTLPNIAGYVGADTVGVLLATDLHNLPYTGLAIDIGTNGEMALGSREGVLTCSTAAGPAFEGAHLSCGMRAADGAIDAVVIDDTVQVHWIGKGKAQGICGSGLVDVVAELLQCGVIEPSGRIRSRSELEGVVSETIAARVVEGEHSREFILVPEEETIEGRAVKLTQLDVRELQLAKAAIRAGIQVLIQELGISQEEIREVFLAGAFGNYIRPKSALRIGLLPTIPRAKITPVGNAAGSGAKLALISEEMRQRATEIAKHTKHIVLSNHPNFQKIFIESMIFPTSDE